MRLKKTLPGLLFVFLVSLCAQALWLCEVLFVKGWAGLGWLSGTLYSPWICALFVVLSFIVPFILQKQIMNTHQTFTAFTLLYVANMLCYYGGLYLCHLLYCRFCFWTKGDVVLLMLAGLLLFIFLAFSYWIITNNLIRKIKKITFIYFLLISLLIIPFAWLSVYFFPGFGTSRDFVDAVKMGYPVFWTSFLLGVAGVMAAPRPFKQADAGSLST